MMETMRKKTLKTLILNLGFCALFFLSLMACKKSFNGQFAGTWFSTDPQETLNFISDRVFTKRFYDGLDHTFMYWYTSDSVTIQYSGPDKILVKPTTHAYKLQGDELTIDFTSGCYGFDKRIIEYIKK